MTDEAPECRPRHAAYSGSGKDRMFQVECTCGRVITNAVFVDELTGTVLPVHMIGGEYSTDAHEARAWKLEKLGSQFGEEAPEEYLDKLLEGAPDEWAIAYLESQHGGGS